MSSVESKELQRVFVLGSAEKKLRAVYVHTKYPMIVVQAVHPYPCLINLTEMGRMNLPIYNLDRLNKEGG